MESSAWRPGSDPLVDDASERDDFMAFKRLRQKKKKRNKSETW